jgi:hypothetical protein
MPSKEVSNLAEKIARLIEAETSQPDLSAVVASIEKISQRLDRMESALSEAKSPNLGSQPQISNSPANHPSQARFTLAEAIADAIIDSKTKEKACTFEPNGKPCDHCGMCSSRGF